MCNPDTMNNFGIIFGVKSRYECKFKFNPNCLPSTYVDLGSRTYPASVLKQKVESAKQILQKVAKSDQGFAEKFLIYTTGTSNWNDTVSVIKNNTF